MGFGLLFYGCADFNNFSLPCCPVPVKEGKLGVWTAKTF